MAKKQGKKRAVISSILSLILCLSMLIGTTMAWFTDTVTNTGNRIETGGLGVQLLKYNGTEYVDISEDDGKGDIFMTEGAEGERLNGVLWESGKTEVVYLQVKNNGTLALNYNILLDIQNDEHNTAKLNEALTYAIVPGDYSKTPFTSWSDIVASENVETDGVPEGEVTAAENGAILAGASDYFALAVHMDEEAGNMYQHQLINIDVKITAKQMPYEKDSFDDQYDAAAEYEKEEEEEEEPSAPVNLFLNPGFEASNEAGTVFDNWTNNKKKADANTIIAADTTTFNSGAKSVKLSTTAAGSTVAVRQDVTLEPGCTYVVSGYFKVSEDVLSEGIYNNSNAVVNIAQYNAEGIAVVNGKNYVLCGTGTASSPCVVDQKTVKAGEWMPFSFEITAGEQSYSAVIFFRQNLPGGTVWFDDLCIMEKVEYPNMFLNPGFEASNEAGTVFDNWTNNKKKADANTIIAADTTTFNSGAKSVKLSTTAAGSTVAVRQDVTLEPGCTYVVSGYFKVSEDVLSEGIYNNSNAVVNIAQYNAAEEVVVSGKNYVLCGTGTASSPCMVDQKTVKAGEWMPFSFEITAGEQSYSAVIFFRQNIPGGTVWFDDLSIKRAW